jgi:hypothetical protein
MTVICALKVVFMFCARVDNLDYVSVLGSVGIVASNLGH